MFELLDEVFHAKMVALKANKSNFGKRLLAPIRICSFGASMSKARVKN